MTDSRIRIVLTPDPVAPVETVRLEQEDVQEPIPLHYRKDLSAAAYIGLATIMVGAILVITGVITFFVAYPDQWFVSRADTVQTAQNNIELVEILWGLGMALTLTGTSLFFYGRRQVGEGRSRDYKLHGAQANVSVGSPGAAAAAAADDWEVVGGA